MSDTRQALVDRANELNIEFAPNVGEKKLAELIREAENPGSTTAPKKAKKTRRQQIAEFKEKAYKTSIVTITNRDPRETSTATTAPLSVENDYFGIAKNVPLDIPVELEQCLIDQAEQCQIPHHKLEVVEGKETGNKVTVLASRYTVSYAKAES